MITRSHEASGTRSTAHYSECGRYRYALSRRWQEAGPLLLFVMLNPSTADERRNDPTIARCERRARDWGYGALGVVNLFAFRATRPRDLFRAEDPVGPEADAVLLDWHQYAARTIAGWGVHGARLGRGAEVARACGELWHLGLTRDGHPRHPLYVAYSVAPAPWHAAGAASGPR